MKIFSCVKQSEKCLCRCTCVAIFLPLIHFSCGFLLTLGAECHYRLIVMPAQFHGDGETAERFSEPHAASETRSGFMFLALHCDGLFVLDLMLDHDLMADVSSS